MNETATITILLLRKFVAPFVLQWKDLHFSVYRVGKYCWFIWLHLSMIDLQTLNQYIVYCQNKFFSQSVNCKLSISSYLSVQLEWPNGMQVGSPNNSPCEAGNYIGSSLLDPEQDNQAKLGYSWCRLCNNENRFPHSCTLNQMTTRRQWIFPLWSYFRAILELYKNAYKSHNILNHSVRSVETLNQPLFYGLFEFIWHGDLYGMHSRRLNPLPIRATRERLQEITIKPLFYLKLKCYQM